MMKYKGYVGYVNYDDKAKIFHGEIVGIKDVITFQGRSVNEIEQAFRESVDDYLDFCKRRKERPEKPYSGCFNLRIPKDLHMNLVVNAKMQKKSLNVFIKDILEKECLRKNNLH